MAQSFVEIYQTYRLNRL